MTKKTLVFDASILAEGLHAMRGRSGIYFTTYNILSELIKLNTFDISLYCDRSYSVDFVNFIEQS